ncbi:hypothetical protein JCM3766R1_003294 [Sporobolomyces carnicolor]
MWNAVLESGPERAAFLDLMGEYFERRGPPPTTTTTTTTLPRPRSTGGPSRPLGLVTTTPTTTTTTSRSPPPSGESFSSRMQTAAAGAALRNTTATAHALTQAGMSKTSANSIAQFGKRHHEALAPHVAAAARHSISTTTAVNDGPNNRTTPSGLQSSKTMAGVGDTSSGKNFAKALFSSKGPLSKAEQDKNKYQGPLYVKPVTKPGSTVASHAPPPRRSGATATATGGDGGAASTTTRKGGGGQDRVRALYDYEGTDTQDLPMVEGEELLIIERIGQDWLRCRNSRGAEGILPTNYTEPI